MITCVVYYDPVSDFRSEKESYNHSWNVWSRKYPGIAKRVRWIFTNDQTRLHELIPGVDLVFFDYGGLLMSGYEQSGMWFARELEKHIIERPSIEFVLLCTMGKHWYEDNYIEAHPNLHFEEVYWEDLFNKYLGGIDAKN